jgi:transposase
LGNHSKKKSFLFKERDEIKRQEFLSRLESIPFEKRVWVGEEVERPYGRAPRGNRVYGERSGKIRHSRTTVIAAYRQKKTEAPFRFRGHTNTAVFNTGVEGCLVPVLEEEDWVILDNRAFHKSPQTRKAIEAKGAHILFLPPYSPDLNDIEHLWATLKARIRKDKYQISNFYKISTKTSRAIVKI